MSSLPRRKIIDSDVLCICINRLVTFPDVNFLPSKLVRMNELSVIDVYPYLQKGDNVLFLLFRRSPGHIYAGQWRMIGGKVKAEERAWEAGLRELREETGLIPDRFWVVPTINHFYDYNSDRILHIPAFAAEFNQEPEIMLNDEHDSYEWMNLEEAVRHAVWPEQRRIINTIHDIIIHEGLLPDWIIK